MRIWALRLEMPNVFSKYLFGYFSTIVTQNKRKKFVNLLTIGECHTCKHKTCSITFLILSWGVLFDSQLRNREKNSIKLEVD